MKTQKWFSKQYLKQYLYILSLLAIAALLSVVTGTIPEQAFAAEATTQSTEEVGQSRPMQGHCGDLPSYTSWFKTGGQWKRTLFVWAPNGEPNIKAVYYRGVYVFPGQKKVGYNGDPQVRDGDWAGYFISKTYAYTFAWDWDNDGNWKVNGCN